MVSKADLKQFSKSESQAIALFKDFIEQQTDANFWPAVTHQVFLGNEAFAKQFLPAESDHVAISEIPKEQQRRQAKPLRYYRDKYQERNQAIISAYGSGGYTQKQIADYFGVHYSTVSRILKQASG